jgi:diguanylate cyclase (GGDEF)-like protein
MRNDSQAIARVAGQTFQSFSSATGTILDSLRELLPGATLVVAQLDHGEGEYRVIDSRSGDVAGLDPGLTLRIGDSLCGHMAEDTAPRLTADAALEPVYGRLELTAEKHIHSYAAAPMEMPDGSRAGSLCAMSTEKDRFSRSDLDVIAVFARLLAYEWERVRREHDLRKLRERLREDDTDTDPVTGLPNRDKFLESLDREWHLAQRGTTVSTYVVVISIDGFEKITAGTGLAMGNVLLRDVARSLAAVRRRADFSAVVAPNRFAVALIGCRDDAGVLAFVNRLRPALARATIDRPVTVTIAHGSHPLAESGGADDALKHAEQSVGATPTLA